ncbi:hypothetical protein CWRG_02123 [Chthonomonas calidirosea]|uniref:phosphate-starvation-inducible PsiE family protein n=1 Tax=Chthonomonas calidirosea TaxID=454171 RepID=UPI0006DD40CD|nr:phosphate-starvation-inducible PsiE family protein [Chthonomonas calidirosea]CEK18307.1 hypothetical protein CWRG_02123 [Chthonomonas calidirosea]
MTQDEPTPQTTLKAVASLEGLDNLAHIGVAVLFILAAASVLLYSFGLFLLQVVHIANGIHAAGTGAPHENSFLQISLELLSGLLFAVILLELLRTILTYLIARSIEATLKEFLLVGIISLVRKILLVGAQASLSSEGQHAFLQEALGTLVSVLAVLLLIGGLILLKRFYERA